MITRLVEHFNNANDFDITKDLQAMGKVRRESEKAKIALSSQTSVSIEIASFHNGKTFSDTLDRAVFERLNESLFEKFSRLYSGPSTTLKMPKSRSEILFLLVDRARSPSWTNC